MERLWHRLMIPASSIHCRDPLYLEAVEPFLITEYWNFLFSFLIFFDECHSKSYLFLDKGHFITVYMQKREIYVLKRHFIPEGNPAL